MGPTHKSSQDAVTGQNPSWGRWPGAGEQAGNGLRVSMGFTWPEHTPPIPCETPELTHACTLQGRGGERLGARAPRQADLPPAQAVWGRVGREMW